MNPSKLQSEAVLEQLELLLMDILLKSENPVKRYPLGQLKKRIGDFIQDQIDKSYSKGREEVIEELAQIKGVGVKTINKLLSIQTKEK